MTSVLGLSACVAVKRLADQGIAVRLVEVCCRKGAAGDDARVLRQRILDDGAVQLTVAYFSTRPLQQ